MLASEREFASLVRKWQEEQTVLQVLMRHMRDGDEPKTRISIFGRVAQFDSNTLSIDARTIFARLGSHIECVIHLAGAQLNFADQREVPPEKEEDFGKSFDSLVGIVLPNGIIFEILAAEPGGQLMENVFRK
jgi:hypothetical protein